MIRECEYVVYSGDSFTIEWYFDNKNKSEALEYYNSLKTSERIQLLKLIKRMGDVGEIKDKTKFRSEGDKIYAFKPQPDRFLCFFNEGKKIIITNGFRKKQPKLPSNEKERALINRESYINRLKSGEYYE
jgi:hypothetical protein